MTTFVLLNCDKSLSHYLFYKKRLPLWLYHKRWKTLWYPNVIEVIFVNLFQDHFIFIKHFLEIIKIHAQIIFFCHKFSIFNNIDIFLGHSYCQFSEQLANKNVFWKVLKSPAWYDIVPPASYSFSPKRE